MDPTRFAIVAGEESGDILGADLIQSLKKYFPLATFTGIGGHRMMSEGFESLFPMERLSVMGFIEPLKRLPEILSIASTLKKHLICHGCDFFIGIDSPDFNLPLAHFFKKQGMKTVHYVSPTVWAWRKGRIKKIKKAVDLMLTLFPFEMDIYKENDVNVEFVGHPLAEKIPSFSDKHSFRQALQLPEKAKIVALLPGSRAQELKYLAPLFIETAHWLKERDPDIQFISASPNAARHEQFSAFLHQLTSLTIPIFPNQSHAAMAAADVILTKSGTASLEAMLIKRPTVVAYKMSPWIFPLAKMLVKVPFIALPNLLAQKCIMPEYIQSQVKPELMGKVLLTYLQDERCVNMLTPIFSQIHDVLKCKTREKAAKAIAELIS